MKRRWSNWIWTTVCVGLLIVVATMTRNYRPSPEIRNDIPTAIGRVGERLPDFTLPTLSGIPVSLSQFVGKGPVILTFDRSVDW
ncbi:MAG: hypothetical protein ACREQF_11315 [Candidatus Binataceae bacterium]